MKSNYTFSMRRIKTNHYNTVLNTRVILILAFPLLLLLLGLDGTAQNNNFNSNFIQKRKYTKGYYIRNIPKAEKPDQDTKGKGKNHKAKVAPIARVKKIVLDGIKTKDEVAATSLTTSGDNNRSWFLEQMISALKTKNKDAENKPDTTLAVGPDCDQIFKKNGDTILVRVTGTTVNLITYINCDPTKTDDCVSKSEVWGVRYAGNDSVYENNGHYGRDNDNNFGYVPPLPADKHSKNKKNQNDNNTINKDQPAISYASRETDKSAKNSFTFGLTGFLLYLLLTAITLAGINLGLTLVALFFLSTLYGLLAIILGIIGIIKVANNPTSKRGMGLAIAGLILGIIDFLPLIIFFAILGML